MTFGEDWGWGAPKEEAQKAYNASAMQAATSLTPPTFIRMAPAKHSQASYDN